MRSYLRGCFGPMTSTNLDHARAIYAGWGRCRPLFRTDRNQEQAVSPTNTELVRGYFEGAIIRSRLFSDQAEARRAAGVTEG